MVLLRVVTKKGEGQDDTCNLSRTEMLELQAFKRQINYAALKMHGIMPHSMFLSAPHLRACMWMAAMLFHASPLSGSS